MVSEVVLGAKAAHAFSCSRASKCTKNLREKVLGTNVKEDSEPFLAAEAVFAC
jgi:hypothetical protein